MTIRTVCTDRTILCSSVITDAEDNQTCDCDLCLKNSIFYQERSSAGRYLSRYLGKYLGRYLVLKIATSSETNYRPFLSTFLSLHQPHLRDIAGSNAYGFHPGEDHSAGLDSSLISIYRLFDIFFFFVCLSFQSRLRVGSHLFLF